MAFSFITKSNTLERNTMLNPFKRMTRATLVTKLTLAVFIVGTLAYCLPAITPADAATVATPVFSPSNASLTTKTKINITTATPGATIYYTINGTTPTTSSYKYNTSIGVDLQPGTTTFKIGMYTVKAIAVLSGYTNSSIAQSSFNVSNKDQSSRSTLSGKSIKVNKDDCWLSTKTSCTSFIIQNTNSLMDSTTFNEIGAFASVCDKWVSPTGTYSNKCGVLVTGGTEAGHSGSGTCSHLGGHKFDMSLTTSVTNFIQTSGQFTYQGIRSDGAPMYKRKTGGAIYAKESNHWDVLAGSGCI